MPTACTDAHSTAESLNRCTGTPQPTPPYPTPPQHASAPQQASAGEQRAKVRLPSASAWLAHPGSEYGGVAPPPAHIAPGGHGAQSGPADQTLGTSPGVVHATLNTIAPFVDRAPSLTTNRSV